MAGQFKTFWDSTGQLWMKGALVGKPFGTFTGTATQQGGQVKMKNEELVPSNARPLDLPC